MNDQLNIARSIMIKAHDESATPKRWDGRPYYVHPIKVVSILEKFGITDEKILISGYLHDTLEDTDLNEYAIKDTFGSQVLELVKELTFKDSRDDDEIYYEQIKKLSSQARIIKIADILANITDEGKKSDHFIRKRVNGLKILIDDLVKV
jgi:guanosine-3',5'-bis(diphosphate) 3'-pyrophosphohydrolase